MPWWASLMLMMYLVGMHQYLCQTQGGALLAAALTLSTSAQPAHALPASKGSLPDVGSFLPASGVEDFVEFIPPKGKTPVRRLRNS